MKLSHNDEVDHILSHIDGLMTTEKYGKVIAKIPSARKEDFLRAGFKAEAEIVYGLSQGEGDVAFMARYYNERRKHVDKGTWDRILEFVEIAKGKVEEEYGEEDECEICSEADAAEIAKVYEEVFPSYPFPISDADYIRECIRSGSAVYFAIRRPADDKDNERRKERGSGTMRKIVSLSAAELDLEAKKVEMTDFATLPAYRGQGLASKLLARMGREVKSRCGIRMAFTIARSLSLPMNCTFAKGGYRYAGTLRNNTNISGSIECMNIWHKLL